MREISEEKLTKYFEIAKEAFNDLKINPPKGSHMERVANDYLDMAKRYYDDAKYFKEKGDYVTAFAALNYLHGYLDAGARLGVFKVTTSKYFAFEEGAR